MYILNGDSVTHEHFSHHTNEKVSHIINHLQFQQVLMTRMQFYLEETSIWTILRNYWEIAQIISNKYGNHSWENTWSVFGTQSAGRGLTWLCWDSGRGRWSGPFGGQYSSYPASFVCARYTPWKETHKKTACYTSGIHVFSYKEMCSIDDLLM